MKVRQDAWSEENDLLLAETVLRHVREGSTQLKAFEEVGDQLNRTSAACGFRWNAVVRQQYDKALGLARKHRKQRFRLLEREGKQNVVDSIVLSDTDSSQPAISVAAPSALTMEKVIAFLRNIDSTDTARLENESLRYELEKVKKEKEVLEKQLRHLEKSAETMREDYETMMKIMDRARKIVVFDEEEPSSTAFKMARNGNLEKIAE